MRHLRSILYALVLAPAVWVLCGVACTGDLLGRERDAPGLVEIGTRPALLLVAGAAYAILVLSPISPAGPLLAGLGFLGVALWAVAAPGSDAGGWPGSIGFDLGSPGYGLAFLLAVPMIGTALSARRWVRSGRAVPASAGSVEQGAVLVAPEPAPRAPVDDEATTVLPDVSGVVAQETQPLREPGRADGNETVTEAVRADVVTVDLQGAETTDDVRGDTATEDVRDGETVRRPPSRAAGPGEKTAVIARDPGEATQIIRVPGEVYPLAGETTRAVVRFDGADPTTRLVPAPEPGEATTAARPMTVLNMERPPDETDDDTRPLTIPAQRHPRDD